MEKQDVDDIFDKFRELEIIEEDKIRFETMKVISDAPDYFWEVPAASSGPYHNPYCRMKYGLWIHTKMVFSSYERIAESWERMGLISDMERDIGRSACLIHDLLKYGVQNEYDGNSGAKQDHDILCADMVDNYTNLPALSTYAINEHMGPWYDGREPSTYLSLLIHTSDMIASSPNITVGVYKPHEKIRRRYPNIPRADL
jgi:hypothetical protein